MRGHAWLVRPARRSLKTHGTAAAAVAEARGPSARLRSCA